MSDGRPLSPSPDVSGQRNVTINVAQQNADVMVVLRPMQGDWAMGDDWEVERSYNSSFVDLKEFIEEQRGINRHRIQIRLKGKILIPNREKWALRRLGISHGTLLLIEPTLNGSWYWNPISYYKEKLLSDVEAVIDKNNGLILLSKLTEQIQPPPPISTSLRVFLRTFPERIHIHTNVGDNTMYVSRAKGLLEPPTFTLLHPALGYFQHYKIDVSDIIEDVVEEPEEEPKEYTENGENAEQGGDAVQQVGEEETKSEEDADTDQQQRISASKIQQPVEPVDEEQQIALNADIID